MCQYCDTVYGHGVNFYWFKEYDNEREPFLWPPYLCSDESFDEWWINIYDGTNQPIYINVEYCPWCGRRLKRSKSKGERE